MGILTRMVIHARPWLLLFCLVLHTQASPMGNEIVIELNEKLAKLQLTISKQTQTIKQLEKDKKELELTISNKCGGQSENVAIGEQSNYANPLWTNTTTKSPVKSTTQAPTVLKTGKQLKSNTWEKLASLDCYAGRGGDPIQPDPYSNSMSLQDCKAACTADYNCQGVIRKTSDGQGSGVCYKRRNVVTGHCVRDPVWELHRKPTSGGSASATSRPPSNSYGCRYGIQGYPRNLPNAHFYTKLCTTNNNLKIVSSSRPTNAALERTAYLIGNVMANVDSRVAQSMNTRGFRHAVMAAYPAEVTTHIPEHAWLGAYWNERARGLGATVATPLGSSAEENALCHSNDRYRVEDITIHEFAHSMHLTGFALVFPTFNSELTGLYNAARYGNLWGTGATGSYAMTDFKEYFAEGVQSYFDTNAPDSYAPVTRDQLWRKDPNLYHFLNRYLGNNPWKRTC